MNAALRAAAHWSVACGLATLTVRADPAVNQADILKSISLLDAGEQAALAKDPALLKQIASLMWTQRLLRKEAREQHWDERPEVQAKMERARETALAESWL